MTSFSILFSENFCKDFILSGRLAFTGPGQPGNRFDNKTVKTITLRFTVKTLFPSNKKRHSWTLLVLEDSDEGISWKIFSNAIFISTNEQTIVGHDKRLLSLPLSHFKTGQ